MGRKYVDSTPATRGEVAPDDLATVVAEEEGSTLAELHTKVDELQAENVGLQNQLAAAQSELATNQGDKPAGDDESSETVTVQEPAPGLSPARPVVSEPAGNASTEEWVAYAESKGAKPKDLVDEKGEPLGQRALRTKFGSHS